MSDNQYGYEIGDDGWNTFNVPSDQLKPNDQSLDSAQNHGEPTSDTDPLSPSNQEEPDAALHTARQHLLEAVRQEGFQAESLEEAWGRIIRVQADIALDPAMGSKSTTAARFLAQALGISGSKMEKSLTSPPEIGSHAAYSLLALIAAEIKRRAETP